MATQPARIKNRALGNLTAFLTYLPPEYLDNTQATFELYLTNENLACRLEKNDAHVLLYFNAGGIWHRDDEAGETHLNPATAVEYIQRRLP